MRGARPGLVARAFSVGLAQQPEWLHHSGGGRSPRATVGGGTRRRGNALIMAVTMTAMLAIIGSSFVLVTRLERQTVRSFGNVQGLDEIQDFVLRRIQTTLAENVVSQAAGSTTPLSRLVAGAGYEPYDAPHYASGVGDPWLAPIEPTATWDAPNSVWHYRWAQVSDVFAAGGSGPMEAEVWTANAPVAGVVDVDMDGVPEANADADGDGIADSIWRQIQDARDRADGNDVFAAVRIIDNCGMLNLNTAWDMVTADPAGDPDDYTVLTSFGALPSQLNLAAVLSKVGTDDDYNASKPTNWLTKARSTQYLRLGIMKRTEPPAPDGKPPSPYGDYTNPTNPGNTYVLLMRNYADWVLRFYEAPASLASKTGWSAPWDLGRRARLFDVGDELALRNRFLLKSDATAQVESMFERPNIQDGPQLGLWNVIGDGKPGQKRRRLPYTDVTTWAGDVLGTADGRKHDIRHLLTTYSFDRTVRPSPYHPGSLVGLDDKDVLGRCRQVDIPIAVQNLLQFAPGQPSHNLAATRLLYAVVSALKDPSSLPTAEQYNQAVQYVANLRDYLDADSELTHYPQAFFGNVGGTDVPSIAVFGFERQPFISEVVVRARGESSGGDPIIEFSAVELCNPYPVPLSLDGYSLTGPALGVATLDLTGQSITEAQYDPVAGTWWPGRLVIASSGPMAMPPGVYVLEGMGASVAGVPLPPFARGDHALNLVRLPVSGSSLRVLVDSVAGTDMEHVTAEEALKPNPDQMREYSLERGILRWRFARNEFDFKATNDYAPTGQPIPSQSGLGRWYAKPHPPDGVGGGNDASTVPGVALPVADRGPIWVPVTGGSAQPRWLVQGWFDVTRPTFIGNPQYGAGTETVTSLVATRITGAAAPGEVHAGERNVRFDLTAVRPNSPPPTDYMASAQRLFEAMGFFARCDDGYDNETGDVMPSPHGPERLSECRIPGRVNVNTAPAAVLEAVFPPLPDDPDILPGVSPTEWADYQKTMRSWFAQVVVHLRDPAHGPGPFTSMDDFFRRLDAFDNASGVLPLEPPRIAGHTFGTVEHIMRYGQLLGYVEYNRTRNTDIHAPRLRDVGDRSMRSDRPPLQADLESRDWLFGRLANLLTVRSDTFTAYILIRLQNANNPAEHSDRRLVALLDRSNVFFPPSLANNDFNDSMASLPPGTPPDYWDRQYVTPKIVAIQQVGE